MRIALLDKVADDEDTWHRVSSTLREFYAVQGTAPARETHDLRHGHGPSTTGPSRI
jgi:hypothetical protein